MKDIKVYVSDTCPYCHMAVNFMKEQGYTFVERNISHDQSAVVELTQMRMRGVPVIVVDGEIIVGYDPNRIKAVVEG